MTTVVLDLGMVLTGLSTQVADAARLLGVDERRMESAYWAHRDAWDRGGSRHAYWAAVGRDLGIDVDPAMADRLTAQDLGLWTTLRPGSRAVLDDLAAAGTTVWLLSNASTDFESALAATEWGPRLAGLVISGVERTAKPDEEIYRIVEQRSGASGDELAFVDDRPENLAVPGSRGWRTHLWRDDEDTRGWLVAQGALPA